MSKTDLVVKDHPGSGSKVTRVKVRGHPKGGTATDICDGHRFQTPVVGPRFFVNLQVDTSPASLTVGSKCAHNK